MDDQIGQQKEEQVLKQNKYDLSIMSSKVLVGETGFQQAIVCIKDERIQRIEINVTDEIYEEISQQSNNFIDYGDKVIMSGVIDINESEWTEIQNLTKIALAGGVTMVVNNPLLENNDNIVELNKNLCDCKQKIQAMLENSYVDFAQLALLTKTNYEGIYDKQKMKELRKSIIGFRTYFSPSFQPEVDYCSNKLQILSFIDSLKDVQDLCIFVHPIYLQCEKELGVTSPLRNQKIESRIEIESQIDIINERRTVPCADAVQGETHEEERWSSLELEPLRNNQIQQKLLKIFPMAQQKTMQSALKLLSIQEKRQYLCSTQNSHSGENNKSDEEEQNQENEDRYLEFKKLNDTKHSFLSIESEDETLNNCQSQLNVQEVRNIKESGFNSLKMRKVSICLESSKFLTSQVDNGQSYEDLTETGSRTTYRNSLSPKKDQDKQMDGSAVSDKQYKMKLNLIDKNQQEKQNLQSNQQILNIPQRNVERDEQSEESPGLASISMIRPKSNSNLLVRRKLQLQKADNLPPQQGSFRKVSFLMHSNSNLYLPCGSEINSNDILNSNQNIVVPNISKQSSEVCANKIEEEDDTYDKSSQRQINCGGGYNRIRSQTSSFMLNTKLKSRNLEMQQKLRKDYLNFLTFRPPFWENIAINFFKQKFTEYQQNKTDFKPSLIFTNVSNSYSVAKIFRQRLRNPNFKLYLEISSPFLYFDSSSIKEGETKFKNEPAIYDKLNKKLLLSELEIDSVVDCVGSNHFYVPPKYKPPDFTRAFNGLNSIGANLYSLWTLSWINLKRKFKQIKQQKNQSFLSKDNTPNFIHQDSQGEESEEEQQEKQITQACNDQCKQNEIQTDQAEFDQQTGNEIQTSELSTTNIQTSQADDYKQGDNINSDTIDYDNQEYNRNDDDNIKDESQQQTNSNNVKQNNDESQEKRIERKILELSKLLSINPAKILGISDQKGQIKVGLDADFVVWSPFEQSKFTVDMFQQNPDIAPLHIFDRKNFYGRVYATIIRGTILYQQTLSDDKHYQHKSSCIMDEESSEKLSPFLKKNLKDFNPHNFVAKEQFQAKLITKN